MDDLIESFRRYEAHILRDGRWKRARFTRPESMPAVFFDFGFGRRRTAVMDLDEMLRLPEVLPSLRRAGFSVAGFDPVTDWVTSMLIMLALPIFRHRPVTPLSKLFCWSTRTFGRPPHGVVVQFEGEGTRGGEPVRLRLALFHENGYELTAIPAVSLVEQLLDGTVRQPGLHLMGLAVDPARLLADMGAMGVRVRAATASGSSALRPQTVRG